MTTETVSPKVARLVIGGVVVAAVAAVAGTWAIERQRDLIAVVPGLGSFVIRDASDVIQSKLFLGKPWEPNACAVFARYVTAGSSVADIGAYNGVHTVRFGNLVGPMGHVYAFEPNPASFDMLKANIALNGLEARVTAYPYGVAEKTTIARLFTAPVHNQGGTVVCSDDDVRERRRGCELAVHETPLVRIDDDVARWFPARVGFVKIDVEGFEDRVLNGARGWIARDRPLIWIEIWDDAKRSSEHMPMKSADVVALIHSLGYRTAIHSEWDYLFEPLGATPEQAPPPSPAP